MKQFLSKLNIFAKRSKPNSSINYQSSLGSGAKYNNGLSGGGYPFFIANSSVRKNARAAFHDTPEARAIVTRFADTVVDTGLRLESVPRLDILGITSEEAEKWARNVESRFDLWAKSKKSDRRGLSNFYQTQRLYQISQQRDNDIFTRLYYSKEKRLSNPLQISILDPNQIKSDSITSTYAFSTINDGIKRNERGEETEYSICVRNSSTGDLKFVEVPRVGRISKKIMMLHGFCAEYAGQVRGYSRLEHILQELNDLTDFKISNIKKAISQSQITMYTKPSSENDASNPLEDIASVASGPLNSPSLATAPGDLSEEELGCPVGFDSIPEAVIRTPGSVGVFNLKKGEDLKTFPTQAAAESYDQFIDSYMSYVSASTGIPNEVLLMKFGENYSASRGALLLFWRVVGIWREEMNSDFNDPIYEAWLSEEVASGRISAPGFSDPTMREAWLNNKWIGAPMPNIDPMRTAKAEQTYVELGATNLDRVARDYNGSDGASNRRKLEKQFAELPTAPWLGQQTQNTDGDK